jgi:hypothetical protein
MVVPTFAPMMMGTALCNVTDPDATSATTMDVVAELLCSIAVTSRPINKPVKGFDVARNIDPVMFFPMFCNDVVMRSSENRKRMNALRMARAILILLLVCTAGSVG